MLKKQLAAYALNVMESRKGKVLSYSGLMQFDWDHELIKEYDMDELMQAIFDLPFIAFCGKSCTGTGFYAFAMIAEPEKLRQYAEHCFKVLEHYSIPVDTSKGRNYNDLRYVSYDCNMMIKDGPIPLKIKRFFKTELPRTNNAAIKINNSNRIIRRGLEKISSATPGERWPTVRKVSYTLGGIPGTSVNDIINVILNSPQYADGYDKHCIKCAEDSFNAGRKNPLAS